jgi:hypothetical protein
MKQYGEVLNMIYLLIVFEEVLYQHRKLLNEKLEQDQQIQQENDLHFYDGIGHD